MKRIIIFLLLLILVGCSASEPEHHIIPVGKVESVEVVDVDFGASQQMKIVTDKMVLFVLYHHSVEIGAELEIVTEGFYYDGDYYDCVKPIESDHCWRLLK